MSNSFVEAICTQCAMDGILYRGRVLINSTIPMQPRATVERMAATKLQKTLSRDHDAGKHVKRGES